MRGFFGTSEETVQQTMQHTLLNVFFVSKFVTLLADR